MLRAVACALWLALLRAQPPAVPKLATPWASWMPPAPEALREFEVGFSTHIDSQSMLLKKDMTPRMAFQGNCDVEHMKTCQYCTVQAKVDKDVHEGVTPDNVFEHDLMLLVDDRPLAQWSRLKRFIRPAVKFGTRGLADLDSYCSAWHDGAGFEMVYARGKSVWRSADGVAWVKKGGVTFNPDAGYDVCVSRIGERPGAVPYFLSAGIGAKQCTIRQPRLFSTVQRGANLNGRPISYGSDMGRSVAKKDCNGRPWEFLKTNHSLIPAGGDTCTAVYYNAAQGRDVLTARYNVCTKDSKGQPRWREIRGLEVRQYADARQLNLEKRSAADAWEVAVKTYFDVDSKADRYRMQIYNLQAKTYPFPIRQGNHSRLHDHFGAAMAPVVAAGAPAVGVSSSLHLGIFTVLNYPKAQAVPIFKKNCTQLRGGLPLCDTVDSFLATSRDGVSFDSGWVYEREPLIKRGVKAADSHMVLGCGAPFAHGGFMFYYYVGYPVGHEHRPESQKVKSFATFGAKWPIHAMVGVKPDANSEDAVVVTKPFKKARHVSLLVEATASAAGAVKVELLRGEVVLSSGDFSVPRVTPPIGGGDAKGGFPCVLEFARDDKHAHDDDGAVLLRLTLEGAALYAARRGAGFGHGYIPCNIADQAEHADGAPESAPGAASARAVVVEEEAEAAARLGALPSAGALSHRSNGPPGERYFLRPHVQTNDGVLSADQRAALAAKSATLFPADANWITAAVEANLFHWRRGWRDGDWPGEVYGRRTPQAAYVRFMLRVSVGSGAARITKQLEKYKAQRINGYMKLFSEVAAKDSALNININAFPADGCPGNAESYLEMCRFACEKRGPAPTPSCEKRVGFLPMCAGSAFDGASRGRCCLREGFEGPVRSRQVLPAPVKAPVLCFQKDATNSAAALLPEIQMLYSNMYTEEKHARDPVQWKDKVPSGPADFDGSPLTRGLSTKGRPRFLGPTGALRRRGDGPLARPAEPAHPCLQWYGRELDASVVFRPADAQFIRRFTVKPITRQRRLPPLLLGRVDAHLPQAGSWGKGAFFYVAV